MGFCGGLAALVVFVFLVGVLFQLRRGELAGSTTAQDHPAPLHTRDMEFMQIALRQARKAALNQEVPIGAVLVDAAGTVVAEGHNRVESDNDASAHAEIVCLRKASRRLGNWRLKDTTLYTTIEPCPMVISLGKRRRKAESACAVSIRSCSSSS